MLILWGKQLTWGVTSCPSWASVGCPRCVWRGVVHPGRALSIAALHLTLAPFGSVRFGSNERVPFREAVAVAVAVSGAGVVDRPAERRWMTRSTRSLPARMVGGRAITPPRQAKPRPVARRYQLPPLPHSPPHAIFIYHQPTTLKIRDSLIGASWFFFPYTISHISNKRPKKKRNLTRWKQKVRRENRKAQEPMGENK